MAGLCLANSDLKERLITPSALQGYSVDHGSSLGEVYAFQLKYCTRGVGEVRVGWKGTDATQEELELIELVQLSPEQLMEVHSMALELENHAYEISDVYRQTSPLE